MCSIEKHSRSKPNFMNSIMDEIFHPQRPICKIIPSCLHNHSKQDIFKKYRPLRGTCVDYNISQTDAKLDAGDTKIHLQHTIAEYIPYLSEAPPIFKQKKNKYFSGGPPKWEFWDEKWRKNVEKQQKIYHEEFKKRVAARKQSERGKLLTEHRKMLIRVGPEWFQELSPQQLDTVNILKFCIRKDLIRGTIKHTQQNIADLGLVLRPNHRHIQKALLNCCKCPVEFLLILYQLINPNRKNYSINDRLLLSAVAHLTMRDTLRELHIRIPSPPSPPKIKPIKPKKRKKVHYDSPYLEPYTFIREKPKFTGIYCNKHLQYPESPYFSYLEEYKKLINQTKESNSKPRNQPESPYFSYLEEHRKLINQTKEINSKPNSATQIVDAEIVEETKHAQIIYERLVDYRPVRSLLKPSRYVQCYNFRNKKPPSEEIFDRERIMTYLKSFEGNEEEETNDSIECTDSQCYNQKDLGELISVQSKEEETTTEARLPKTILTPIKLQNGKEVKKHVTKSVQCDCKDDSRKVIETPLCQCEECVEDRMKKTTTPVVAGMKEILSKEVIPIIDQIIAEQSCECLKTYDQRVEDYELYQKRKELVYDTTKTDEKFVIGGVVNKSDGPVIMVSGLLPKYECSCHDKAREEEAERQHLANMPHAPPGRIQHGIGGVKETPKGNVYIIDNTLPSEPCDCMQIYDHYQQKHSVCLEVYEKYMEQMKQEMTEFMNEKVPSNAKPNKFAETEDGINVYDQNIEKIEEEANRIRPPIEEIDSDVFRTEYEEEPREPRKESWSRGVVEAFNKCRSICGKSEGKLEVSTSLCCFCGMKKNIECNECTCGAKVETPCIDCTCGPPEVEVRVEEVKEEPLKRFFIYEKILCNHEWQMEVIKKALESMADDGYPLAKLPDCYKLPHFKLWMQMRCRKFWTQEDRYKSVLLSKSMWRHLDFCTVRIVRLPTLPITKSQASLVNWSKAPFCRDLVNQGLDKFYRKLRQNQVHFGREYFPSFITYPFPFSTYRDCYFAYTPSKEEDVLARFVWKKFEFNNMADVKHCL